MPQGEKPVFSKCTRGTSFRVQYTESGVIQNPIVLYYKLYIIINIFEFEPTFCFQYTDI